MMIDLWEYVSASDEDCAALTKLAEGKQVCCELGSFVGKTAKAILKSKSVEKLYCVDVWMYRPKKRYAEAYSGDNWVIDDEAIIYKEFHRRLKPEIESGRVIPTATTTKQFAKVFRAFDLVFIDAEHNYESVKFDIANYLPKLSLNGIICGHDFSNEHPGVVQAVKELLPNYKLTGNSIWYYANINNC